MIPWDVQVPRSVEDSCTITLHPGGTSGVELKLKFSYSWLQVNNSVLIQDRQSILRVMTTCLTNCFHCWLAGNLSSIPYIYRCLYEKGAQGIIAGKYQNLAFYRKRLLLISDKN